MKLATATAAALVVLAGCTGEPTPSTGDGSSSSAAALACKQQVPPWRATAKKAIEEGQPQYATAIAGECAEIMGDEEMQRLLAQARVQWHLNDVNNSSLPADHRLATLEALGKLDPAAAKAVAPKIREQLTREMRRAAQAEIAARKRRGVSIGMTPEEVLQSSWGKPEHINRTTTSRGVSEQWVYEGRNYLYFDNGRLTTIQN